jgi:hypothetical protein
MHDRRLLEDRMSPTLEGRTSLRFAAVLLLSLALCLWQTNLSRNAQSMSSQYRLTASVALCGDVRNFFYFFYYFNQFPVGCRVSYQGSYTETGAQEFVKQHGKDLIMDFSEPCNTVRYGDYGKIFLFWPAAWVAGSPANPSVVLFNAIFFLAALEAVLFAFWRSGHLVLGVLLVVLVGSNPFQLYEVYMRENVFSLPISATLLVLALHVRFLMGGAGADRSAWLIATVTGIFLACLRELRTEPALIGLVVPFMYLTIERATWRSRVGLVAVLACAYLVTASGWRLYFDRKITEATQFVERTGGHPYRWWQSRQHHPVWHPVFLGLGDFGTQLGYAWTDRLAYKYAISVLRPPYHLAADTSGGYYFVETYDADGLYKISPLELPGYDATLREKLIADVLGNPGWYLDILWKRFCRIMRDVTPVSVMFGTLHWSVALSGWFILPTFVVVAYFRRTFLAKLLVFSLPLSLTPLFVYSGEGTTYYAIFHIVTVCVWCQLALDLLKDARGGQSPSSA